jgi:carboxyl-terminal processing protease
MMAPNLRRFPTTVLAALLAVPLATACNVGEAGNGGGAKTPGDPEAPGATEPQDGGGEPIDNQPFAGCEGTSPAHESFNALWKLFDEKYAVFDYRLSGKSWKQLGREACPSITAGMSDEALYDAMLALLQNLDDGHTNLTAEALGRDEDAQVNLYPFEDALDTIEDNVDATYVDDELTFAAEDSIGWGSIGNLGYIGITSLDELSASGDEDDDRAAATAAMKQALAALGGKKGLIIDVRANGGGWDSAGLDIAAHVAGERAVTWSKQVRNGPDHLDFGESVPTYVEAAVAGAFAGPVVLLTSGNTFSAAETFTLAMRVRPNVTVLGEKTSGHLSDLIDGTLPNGWELTYSGERYTAADGVIYEHRGVPVDVAVPFDPTALEAGTDTMLDAAIAQLGGK